jgi:peptide/nickel transport system ATP-binding protein
MTAAVERNTLLRTRGSAHSRDRLEARSGVEGSAGSAGAKRPLVEIAGLSIGFRHANGGTPLVRNLDLTLHAGECVALVGESGSGKSLTARSLLGLAGHDAVVEAARFVIDGRDALEFGERDWRALRGTFAGLVMQDALVSLDPLRTIGAEVGEVLVHHRLLRTRKAIAARVQQVMADVGIPDPAQRARQHAHELSGGLRQRALIASAVAGQPALIIADEPTTALDVTVQVQVLAVLAERLKQGVGVLLISHDLSVVAGIADRVLVMHDGVVVDAGTHDEVLTNPRHPYTKQLLAARPSASSKGYRLGSARFVGVSGEGQPVEAQPAVKAAAEAVSIVREPLPPRHRDTSQTVLEVQGIGKRYRRPGTDSKERFTALEDVSFTVSAGEVVGIVGESGSGKSTCANIVLGLLEPDAGDVRLLGAKWNGHEVRERERTTLRTRLQYIPQDPLSSFDPRYTVRRLLEESLFTQRLSKPKTMERAVALLEQVGLSAAFLDRRPPSLSGGQRQRIAIARALAPEPALIVCDEPVSALDVYVQAQVLDLLAELQAKLGTALLFISHDLDVVQHISDRVLVFKEGRLIEQGEPEQVFGKPVHPYTRLLVSAVRGSGAAAKALEGAGVV